MTHVGRDRLARLVDRLFQLSRRLRALVWLVSLTWLSGCMSTDVFQADELPPNLQAPHIENSKTLDLSRLATGTYGSDAIDRGDVLEVAINVGLNPKDNVPPFQARVSETGLIRLPEVGDVAVLGLEPESAEAVIAAAYVQSGVYRSPHVTVTVRRQRTNRVMIGGGVKQPGVYHLPRGSCDLLSAVFAGGGLADDAGTSVEIRNPPDASNPTTPARVADGLSGPANITQTGHSQSLPAAAARTAHSYRVDLVSATHGGATTYPLQDGAIVMVERRDPPPVHVMGLVRTPGQYAYPVTEELRLLSAIAKANGTNNHAADKVYVIRQAPGQPQPSVIQVSIRQAKRRGEMNLRLAPGDIVSVEQTPATLLLDTLGVIRFALGTSLTPLL